MAMADTTGQPLRRPQIQRTPIESDRNIQRARWIRWAELFLWASLLVGGGALLGAYLVALPLKILFPQAQWISFILGWLGAGAGGESFSRLFGSRLTKIVPRNQGLVTTHLLGGLMSEEDRGAMVVYGPGLHLSSVFEEVGVEGNYSTKIFTLPFSASVPTTTTEILTDGVVQLRANLPRLRNFAHITESVLVEGLVGAINGHLQERQANAKAEDETKKIAETSAFLTSAFGIGEANEPTEFEEEYGVDIIAIIVTSLDLPKGVQEARDTHEQLNQVMRQVALMAGYKDQKDLVAALESGSLDRNQYRNLLQLALLASKATEGRINIHEVSGGGGNIAALASVAGASANESGRSRCSTRKRDKMRK